MKQKLFIGLIFAITIIVLVSIAKIPSNLAQVDQGRTKLTKNINTVKAAINPAITYQGSVGHNKLVALTIDDGPDPKFTPQILNILERNHIKATFFVVGESIKQHPDLLIKEIKMGNEIENHTYTHPDLKVDGVRLTQAEILRDQNIIEDYTHKKPHYFRPPKGLLKKETLNISQADGYKTVLWTICVEHSACKTSEEMATRVIKAAIPGMIILAHDGRLNRSRTMAALPLIINGYEAKGYRFVTLDEMLKHEQHPAKPRMVAGK